MTKFGYTYMYIVKNYIFCRFSKFNNLALKSINNPPPMSLLVSMLYNKMFYMSTLPNFGHFTTTIAK